MAPPGELRGKSGMVYLQCKSCVIHAERFRSGVIHLMRYANGVPLTFTFFDLCIGFQWAGPSFREPNCCRQPLVVVGGP